MADDDAARLAAVNDALQAVNALLERPLEEHGIAEEDELVRLISGVRGALVGIAAEYGGFD